MWSKIVRKLCEALVHAIDISLLGMEKTEVHVSKDDFSERKGKLGCMYSY